MKAKELILEFIKDKDILNRRDFSKEAIEIKPLMLSLHESTIDLIMELQDVCFYDDDTGDFEITLSRFKDAIMNEISPVEPALFTRRKSPPLEAYEYKGCTRIVKDSGSSYGLLFE